MPSLKREDGELQLSLSGAPDFNEALARVRSISGRRFDGDRKLWIFPDDPAIAERVMLTIRPTADKSVLDWVRNSRAERDAELTTPLPDDAGLQIPWAGKLFDFQRAAVNFIAEHPRMLLGDSMGLGKLQSVDSKVLTPFGWVRIGDIRVGHEIIGVDGLPHTVFGTYPQDSKELFRVTFSDGASTLAGAEHLWLVRNNSDRNRKSRANLWRIVHTQELMNFDGGTRWDIPLVDPVQFYSNSTLPIHPYFLGVLLGDGGLSTVTPHITSADPEIIQVCRECTEDEIRQLVDPKQISYSVCGSRTTTALRELGLAGKRSFEKHIPEIYLRASVDDRLAILQGLMDTDGYNQTGRAELGGTSAEIAVSCSDLADGIQELVWSLGGTANRRIKPTTHLDSHRITVKLPPGKNPFRLQRKVERYIERTKYPIRRFIQSVEYEQTSDAVCIAVDAPYNLYVTDDYVVTHNTVTSLSGVHEVALRGNLKLDKPRLVIAPNAAKGVWQREIKKWLGKDEPYALVDAPTPKKREQQLLAGIKENAWCITNWEQVRAVKTVEEAVVNHRDGSNSVREHISWKLKQPLFEQTEWSAVIADEAHRAKNHKSQTARGLWHIEAPIKLALSGTPLQNHPAELWSILRWLYPEQYNEKGKRHNGIAWAYWPFYDEYVEDYDSGYGKVIVGVKNPDALRFELKNRLVRRTKGEKLNLPEKVREVVPVKLNPKQRKIYNDAETKFWLEIQQAIEEGDKQAKSFAEKVLTGKKKIYELANGASRTVRLRQVASTPALLGGEDDSAKLDAAVEIITDAQPKSFVVFTEFVGTANILVERLRKKKLTADAFTGEVKDTRVRSQMEDDFQAGEIDVLVGTLAAMRESITLTAADTVIFIERSWVPSQNEQAEDRLWRQGQKNQVTVLILEAENTVDEDKVRPTNQIKEAIVSSVIKKDEVRELDSTAAA